MKTPIIDFINSYILSDPIRFHMPGHKGIDFLGCEHLDLTEIPGADSLYEADGIISESEKYASELFGSEKTVYSAEGSSQCIRAMLYLAVTCRLPGTSRTIAAARNVHKSFIYAAAMLDFKIKWLWPDRDNDSLCRCDISPASLESTLQEISEPPAAVYITSPDYLGNMADIEGLAAVCHRCGTVLMVDNAHGSYLRFLQPSIHPLDLGADLCCDSAHKTLPVLTGGAYLHLSKNAPAAFREELKPAMALFGSTSPSYLILASLDLCNRYLLDQYPEKLRKTVALLEDVRTKLEQHGWHLKKTDPLRITIQANAHLSGTAIAEILRENHMECEYSDPEHTVLMLTPENRLQDFEHLISVLGVNSAEPVDPFFIPRTGGKQAVSVREAFFAPHETVPVEEALGRICGCPAVSCPPAVPVLVSGEIIDQNALEVFYHYGITSVQVLKS